MTTSTLTAETWERAGALFDRLAALPPEKRELQALDQPRAVRALLEQMLIAHDTADPQLLDQTARAVAGRLLAPPEATQEPADYRGRTFGPWRALEEIGRGGMAVVLRGERADGQFEKEVAIKLLPHAGDGIERERLLEEIRILARLEHPNIARLIDGGIGDDGVPYLVMEYVHGRPITDDCHARNLDTPARVELFLQVCDAVLFAHRHLVVHCDIKPGNILVDHGGRARLVDFGIAGLISSRAERAPRGLFCSPGYASPEQLRGAPPAISQDTFSLGAVLYELLCDQRIRDNPAATRLLFGVATDQQTIAPPSQRSGGRKIDHDLDAICLKALATAPDERYASIADLVADLHAWRQRRPVTAREAGAGYRIARWLRRHWLPAAAMAAVVVALLGGTGVALWQAREARLQAAAAVASNQRAELVRNFLVELFEASDPDISAGRVPDARELLETGSRQVQQAFAGSPLLQAELLHTLARIHRKLGAAETAGELLSQATAVAGDDPSDLHWRLQHEQAALLINQTEYRQALELLDRIETEMDSSLDDEARISIDIARIQALGRIEERTDEALALGRRILDQPLVREGSSKLAVMAHSTHLGQLAVAGELEEAREVGQKAVELVDAGYASPSRRIAIYNNLASVERRSGSIEAAIEWRRQALDLARQVFPPPHYQQAYLAGNLGGDLAIAGQLTEAREFLEFSTQMFGEIFAEPNTRTAGADNNLGLLLLALEHPAEALPYLQATLDVYVHEAGPAHPQTLIVRINRASALSRLGRLKEAETELLEVMAHRRRLFGDDHHSVLLAHAALAAHYLRADDEAQALEHADRALAGWRQQFPQGHPRMYTAMGYRAKALAGLGRPDEAQRTFEEILERVARPDSEVDRNYLRTLERYSEFLVEHRPALVASIVPQLLADPHIQGMHEHPAWLRMQERLAENTDEL